MDKKKLNRTFNEFDKTLIIFFREMKWILNSNRGKKFQYMMLSRSFESLMTRNSLLRKRFEDKEESTRHPLDNFNIENK